MKNEIPPEAVHEVAFVEDQVSVDAAPLTMLVGLALVETVGAGGGEAAATALVSLPPPQATYVAASHAMPPMHARWYVRSLFTGLLSANQCGHGTPELITRTLGQAR